MRSLPWRTPRQLCQHKSKSDLRHYSPARTPEPSIQKTPCRPRKTGPGPSQAILWKQQRKQQWTMEAKQLQLIDFPAIIQQHTSPNGPQLNQSATQTKRAKLPKCEVTLPRPIRRQLWELPRIPKGQRGPNQQLGQCLLPLWTRRALCQKLPQQRDPSKPHQLQ